VLKAPYISNILKELAAFMFRIAERERMVHDTGQEGAGLRLCMNPRGSKRMVHDRGQEGTGLRLCMNPQGTISPGKVLGHSLN
jgi:hypothetical protein